MVSFLCDGQGSDRQAVLSHDRSCFYHYYYYHFTCISFAVSFLWDSFCGILEMIDFYIVSFSKITYGRYNKINLSKNNLA